jgi:hypothetical protein
MEGRMWKEREDGGRERAGKGREEKGKVKRDEARLITESVEERKGRDKGKTNWTGYVALIMWLEMLFTYHAIVNLHGLLATLLGFTCFYTAWIYLQVC